MARNTLATIITGLMLAALARNAITAATLSPVLYTVRAGENFATICKNHFGKDCSADELKELQSLNYWIPDIQNISANTQAVFPTALEVDKKIVFLWFRCMDTDLSDVAAGFRRIGDSGFATIVDGWARACTQRRFQGVAVVTSDGAPGGLTMLGYTFGLTEVDRVQEITPYWSFSKPDPTGSVLTLLRNQRTDLRRKYARPQ